MNVLNIDVPSALVSHWRAWLVPAQQPFFLTEGETQTLGLGSVPRDDAALTPELRDTFTLWSVRPAAKRVVWLSPAQWAALPARVRRDLLRAQVRHGRGNVPLGRQYRDLRPGLPVGRFLWLREDLTAEVLTRLVAQDAAPCQRARVPEVVWHAAEDQLPGARALAGTFPAGSAGNCFGTVMGAAGVPGAAHTWVQREPFEAFLAARTRRGGQDDQPGTLLIWRSRDGLAQHAAVTLGGGWALQKPAQTWWTPRVVLPVGQLRRHSRTRGQRLTRATLI
ncbi:hypothetical protein GO986_03255 [Deinococcus sp. HMF7620]|uniref:Uncharacterized protein n=2 Tax=Deinococcus arboris TaxID=2682977 RepID=A0A7C9LKF3_9DEIO|nr:hypothetical protein [Deinococcus arboris]